MPLFNDKKHHANKPSATPNTQEVVAEPSHVDNTQSSLSQGNDADAVQEDKTVIMRSEWVEKNVQHIGMNDPVVGWLVVIDGIGKGHFAPLGYGQNSIGRGQSERVSLDFGIEQDVAISRTKHALLSYDYKDNKYYLHGGDGVNLTYLNNKPLLAPTELQGGENIVLGETTLRFVPFCGEDFTW